MVGLAKHEQINLGLGLRGRFGLGLVLVHWDRTSTGSCTGTRLLLVLDTCKYLGTSTCTSHTGFTVEGPWQTRSIVSMEVVSWWMLDLARAAAGDKFMSLLQKSFKLY